jgi:predicted dehydrogenase
VKDQLDGQEAALRNGWDPAHGSPLAEPPGILSDTNGAREWPSEPGSWVEFYRQLVAALQATGPVPVPPNEAVNVMRVIEAARQSSLSKAVIPVPVSR